MLLRWVLTRDRSTVLRMADDYGMVIVDAERNNVSLARPKSWHDVVREHAVNRRLSAEEHLSAEEKMAMAVVTAEMAIIPAQKEIYSSLRRGALAAWARPNGSGDIVQISSMQWAALRFRSQDGRDIAIPVDSEHRSLLRRALPDYLDGSVPPTSSPTACPDPLFSAEQAMSLWPARRPNATVHPDATDRPEHGEWGPLAGGRWVHRRNLARVGCGAAARGGYRDPVRWRSLEMGSIGGRFPSGARHRGPVSRCRSPQCNYRHTKQPHCPAWFPDQDRAAGSPPLAKWTSKNAPRRGCALGPA